MENVPLLFRMSCFRNRKPSKTIVCFRIFKFRLLVSKISMCQFRFSVFLVRFRISISEIEFLTSVSNLVFSFFQFPTSCSQCPSCDFQLLYLSSNLFSKNPLVDYLVSDFQFSNFCFIFANFDFSKNVFHSSTYLN